MDLICRVDDCEDTVRMLGRNVEKYCGIHYSRFREYGNPTPTVDCYGCGSSFAVLKESMIKRRYYCDECRCAISDYEKNTYILTASNMDSIRRHGISVIAFVKLAASQDYKCALCKKSNEVSRYPNRRLCVDHDHNCCAGSTSCGKCIRGLLCNSCNMVAGIAESTPNYIEDLNEYLSKTRVFA